MYEFEIELLNLQIICINSYLTASDLKHFMDASQMYSPNARETIVLDGCEV